VVAEGLRHVPDSAVLKRIYKERGGKLPYPEPISPTAQVPAAPAQTRKEGDLPEAENKSQDAAKQAPASPASRRGRGQWWACGCSGTGHTQDRLTDQSLVPFLPDPAQ